MRTQWERDEQTVDIAAMLFGVGLLWAVLIVLVGIFAPTAPVGVVALLLGCGLTVTGLVRMRRGR